MNTKHRNELDDAISELDGLSPQQIANYLTKRKIVGRPGTTGRCPLALFMHGSHGGKFIVGQKLITRQSGKSHESRKTPENLATFVRLFDSGQFPRLIDLIPPRCKPEAARPKASGPAHASGKEHSAKRGAERLQLARTVGRHG